MEEVVRQLNKRSELLYTVCMYTSFVKVQLSYSCCCNRRFGRERFSTSSSFPLRGNHTCLKSFHCLIIIIIIIVIIIIIIIIIIIKVIIMNNVAKKADMLPNDCC